MANRLSRNAPYEITSIDIHSLNDVFRQIQQSIDEMRGLQGPVTIYDTVTFDDDQYATTTDIANVAATESAGTATTVPRGDHVHAHGTGYLPNAHHNQAHAIDGADHTGNLDAAAITFTPADVADWSGSADPGATDDALDQLADRVTAAEAVLGTGTVKDSDFADGPDTDQIWEKVLAGSNITITELANGESISIASSGGAATPHDLLDGSQNQDTVAQTVSRGSLVYGNTTPAWDELTVGANGTVLTSNGTDVAWAAPTAADFSQVANQSEFVHANITTEPWEFVLPGTGITVTLEGDASSALRVAVDDTVVITTSNTNWTDLTDGGATTLHSHAGGSYDATATSGISEFVEGNATVEPWEHSIEVGNITPVLDALPSSPANGDTVILRISTTPYEYVQLTFDSVYNKWVSMPDNGPCSAADATVSTGTSSTVAGSWSHIPNYKAFFDLGLRLQINIQGRIQGSAVGTVAGLRGAIAETETDNTTITKTETLTGATRATGDTNFKQLIVGWQEYTTTPTLPHAMAYIEVFTPSGGGNAIVSIRAYQTRWVAAAT